MTAAEKTCRTCGKTIEIEDGSGLCPLYDSTEYENEIKMTLEEFEIWNLNISQNDGLPQKICLTCFDSFCQIHNFRLMCIEAQMNFGELCTGLDIIIKNEIWDEDDDEFPENIDGDPLIIVQEHYKFPGDELLKTSTSEEALNAFGSNEVTGEITEKEQGFDVKKFGTRANYLELKQYRCEFCMEWVSFDDPDELNRHYNTLHSSTLPYPCPKCDLSFDKLGKRNSHVRCHYSVVPLQCEYCGKKFRGDESMMEEHIAYYHIEKNRECKVCHLKFENISMKKYYYHMQWHNESKLLKCKFCDKKFIQSPHLSSHERTHAGETEFTCKDCGMAFKSSILLQKHILLHERNEIVECPKCPKRYFTQAGIKLHNKKVHDPDKKPAYCEICNLTFIYTHSLVLHNHKKHGGPSPIVATKRTGRPKSAAGAALRIIKHKKKMEYIKPHKCDKCEEAFVLESQLIKHVKVHDEYRPHHCKFCSKSFKRDAHLKMHVNNIHFHRKPYKCSMCTSAFAQRSHLSDHIAVKHENQRKHQCKICLKKFGTWQILKIHSAIHSSERPHICKICDKGFKQLIVLKSHMSRVHLWKKLNASTKFEKQVQQNCEESKNNDENAEDELCQ